VKRRRASRYNLTFLSSGVVSTRRMRPMSRLNDVLASASAGFCICLYSLFVCSCSRNLGSTTTSFLACCISTEQTTENRQYRGENSTWKTALLYNSTFLFQRSLLYRQRFEIVFVATHFSVLSGSERNVSAKDVFSALANAVDKLLITLFTYCFLALSPSLFIRLSTGRNRLIRSFMMK